MKDPIITLEKLDHTLPDLLNTKDLITIGLFNTRAGACYVRKHGKGPPFYKTNDGFVIYRKLDVYFWLLEKTKPPVFDKDEPLKICKCCQKEFPLAWFYYEKKSSCKKCHIKAVRKWQKNNPKKHAEHRENERMKKEIAKSKKNLLRIDWESCTKGKTSSLQEWSV